MQILVFSIKRSIKFDNQISIIKYCLAQEVIILKKNCLKMGRLLAMPY